MNPYRLNMKWRWAEWRHLYLVEVSVCQILSGVNIAYTVWYAAINTAPNIAYTVWYVAINTDSDQYLGYVDFVTEKEGSYSPVNKG